VALNLLDVMANPDQSKEQSQAEKFRETARKLHPRKEAANLDQ
jgi:hypothetical protein